jgi:hypothetical protein
MALMVDNAYKPGITPNAAERYMNGLSEITSGGSVGMGWEAREEPLVCGREAEVDRVEVLVEMVQ